MMASKTEHKRSNRLRASGSEGMRPMNGRRKTLTILVSVAMLLSMLPTNALAEMVGIDGGSAEVVETPTSVIDESGVEAPGADEAPAAGDTDVESEVAQEIAASDGESLVAEAATEDEAAAEGTVADEPRDDATSNDYAEAEPVAGSEAYLSGTLSVEGLDYAVSVDPTEDAKLPANAQLVVSEVSGAAYDEYVAQAESALGKGALSIGRIFDIGFEVEGESVEPASEVSVHIRLANAEEEAAKVLHITDEGVEVIVPDSAPEGSESVDFTVEQLSPFLMQKRNAKGGEQGIITDFNTEVIYGGSWTDGKYVWNAASSASGHHFNFRISFGVDKPAGSEAADIVYPAESIKITVPAQILHDRNGAFADTIDMSVPLKEDLEQAIADGEELDDDMSFAYYVELDDEGNPTGNLVLYNFREVEPGFDGYIELGYVTSEKTFEYEDMCESDPFWATIEVVDPTSETGEKEVHTTKLLEEGEEEDPDVDYIDDQDYTVWINTQASMLSTEKRIPTKYDSWQSNWGTAPDDAADYNYLIYEVRSRINDCSQKYTFTLDDEYTKLISGNNSGDVQADSSTVKIMGYIFSGSSTAQQQNFVTDQTIRDIRYDYVIVGFQNSYWNSYTHWDVVNKITATVTPDDGIDEPTSGTSTRRFNWNKPIFDGGGGGFNSRITADGYYRNRADQDLWPREYLTSLGMVAGYYTRFDLADLQSGRVEYLDNIDYAHWGEGYPISWTRDSSIGGELWEQYFQNPVKYEVYLDNFSIFNGDQNVGTAEKTQLQPGDYQIDTLAFSVSCYDRAYNESTAAFDKKTATTYLEDEVLTFYGKFGESDEWTAFATRDAATGTVTVLDSSLATFSGNKFTFAEGAACTGYKVETTNKHYYWRVNLVPNLRLIGSDNVKDFINGTDEDGNPIECIGIYAKGRENIYSHLSAFDAKVAALMKADSSLTQADAEAQAEELGLSKEGFTNLVWNANPADTDYLRVVQREVKLNKDVTATANNATKRQYTLTWQVDFEETSTVGDGTEHEPVEQSSGVFYDLLPQGATLNEDTVMVVTEDGALRSNAFTIEQHDNYKGTGRTLLVVRVKESADFYQLFFETVHSYASIKDYGSEVYNPIAYQTGNLDISDGVTDSDPNKETVQSTDLVPDPLDDAGLMTDIVKEITGEDDDSGRTFVYNERLYDIVTITAAASGLSKKIKAPSTSDYVNEALVQNEGSYSYRLRYQNSYAGEAKSLVFYDNLESYEGKRASDWQGTLQAIDFSALDLSLVAPEVYVSENAVDTSNADNRDLTNEDVWTHVDDYTNYDYSSVRAVAIDLSKNPEGEDYIINKGAAVSVYLYMKAPAGATRSDGKADYPEAYNEVADSHTIIKETSADQDVYNQQGPTIAKLAISKDINLLKVGEDGVGIRNISFRLVGTSDYGTEYDKIEYSDKNGYVTFRKIEKGSYTFSEYECTPDWLEDHTVHTVWISSQGHVFIDMPESLKTELAADATVDETISYYAERAAYDKTSVEFEIVNKPRVHADLTFLKSRALTEDDNSVKGIPETTFKLSGTSDYGNEITKIVVSNELGIVSIYDIEKGTYTLKEIQANPDYVLVETEYRVKIDDTGNATLYAPRVDEEGNPVVDVEGNTAYDEVVVDDTLSQYRLLFNPERYHDLMLRKVDADNPSRWLQGATVRLTGAKLADYNYTDDEGNTVTATEDNGSYYIETVSDANGKISFPHLEAGSYVLKETEAPSGVDGDGHTGTGGTLNYIADSNEYVVVVADDGTVTIDGLEKNSFDEYMLKNARALDGEIIVYKQWEDDDNADGSRPDAATIKMTADPESLVIKGLTVTKIWQGDTSELRPDDLNIQIYKAPGQIDGYTMVEYIEANGGAWLDTGFNPDSNTTVDATIMMTGNNNHQTLFGARNAVSGTPAFSLCEGHDKNTNLLYYYGAAGQWYEMGKKSLTRDVSYDVHLGPDAVTVSNDFFSSTTPSAEFSVDVSLYIFAYHHDSDVVYGDTQGRIYSFRIYDGSTLVRDYIPVYDATNGVYGLYDLVNGNFISSIGTAQFTGPEVSTEAELYEESTGNDNVTIIKVGNVWTYTFTDITIDGKQNFFACEAAAPEGYTGSNVGASNLAAVQSGKATITNAYESATDYEYTGAVQTFTAPVTGDYKLEAWGAQGGNSAGNKSVQKPVYYGLGGRGAYTSGTIRLTAGQTIYVYVGGRNNGPYRYDANGRVASGDDAPAAFNGGGGGNHDHSGRESGSPESGGSGGGATDFRLTVSTADDGWSGFDSLKTRIMVAAGGGGSADQQTGGYGGALTGGNALGNAYGATQNTGFGFGVGQTSTYKWSNKDGGGAGGGYYGGFAQTNASHGRGNYSNAGAGGSSFVSGYEGCDAIAESSTAASIVHTGSSEHYSGIVFSDPVMLAGNQAITEPDGSSSTGHEGDGHARVTLVVDTNSSTDGSSSSDDASSDTMLPVAEYMTETDGWEYVEGNPNMQKYVFKVFNDEGTYYLEELTDAEHLPEGYTCDMDYQVLDGTKQKSVIFTNRKAGAYGDLEITKTVEGLDDSNQKFEITVTLSDGDGTKIDEAGSTIIDGIAFTNGAATFSLADGEKATIHNIPLNVAYTVSEAANPNFNNGAALADQTGTIQPNTTTTDDEGNTVTEPGNKVALTNVYTYKAETVPLTISKVVTGSKLGSEDVEYPFFVSFTNLAKNFEYVLLSTDGATEYARFTSDDSGNATVSFKLKDGESAVLADSYAIPVDATYQVTENEGDYVASFSIKDAGAESQGSILQSAKENTASQTSLTTENEVAESDEDVTITYTNKLSYTHDLTLAKVVDAQGTTVPAGQTFEFTVRFEGLESEQAIDTTIGRWVADDEGVVEKTFNLKDAGTVTFKKLPVGTKYTITEAKAGGYIASYEITAEDEDALVAVKAEDANEAAGKALATAQETVNKNEVATVTFTNTRAMGELTLEKQVEGKTTSKKFEFELYIPDLVRQKTSYEAYLNTDGTPVSQGTGEIEFDANGKATVQLADNERYVIAVPEGASYKITETMDAQYTASYTVAGGKKVSSPVVSGRTISSEPAENVVIFTNTFATYELPSSGGPGSYPFIICGVAILATALLLLEKNRREEGGNKARS